MDEINLVIIAKWRQINSPTNIVDKATKNGVVREERKKKEITIRIEVPGRTKIPQTQAIAVAEEAEAEAASGKRRPIKMVTKEVVIEDEVAEAEVAAVAIGEGSLSSLLASKVIRTARRK